MQSKQQHMHRAGRQPDQQPNKSPGNQETLQGNTAGDEYDEIPFEPVPPMDEEDMEEDVDNDDDVEDIEWEPVEKI